MGRRLGVITNQTRKIKMRDAQTGSHYGYDRAHSPEPSRATRVVLRSRWTGRASPIRNSHRNRKLAIELITHRWAVLRIARTHHAPQPQTLTPLLALHVPLDRASPGGDLDALPEGHVPGDIVFAAERARDL